MAKLKNSAAIRRSGALSARIGRKNKRAIIVQPLDPERFQIDLLAERVAQIIMKQLQGLIEKGMIIQDSQIHYRQPMAPPGEKDEPEVYVEPIKLDQEEITIHPRTTTTECDVLAEVAKRLKLNLEKKDG